MYIANQVSYVYIDIFCHLNIIYVSSYTMLNYAHSYAFIIILLKVQFWLSQTMCIYIYYVSVHVMSFFLPVENVYYLVLEFKLSFTSQNIINVAISLHESMTMSVCESTCTCICLKLAWLPMQVLYHTSHEAVKFCVHYVCFVCRCWEGCAAGKANCITTLSEHFGMIVSISCLSRLWCI